MQFLIAYWILLSSYIVHERLCVFGLLKRATGKVLHNIEELHKFNETKIQKCPCLCGETPLKLTIDQMVEEQGYKIETHEVLTDDNYVLTLHRMPFSRSGNPGSRVVLIQHGLLGSSEDFVYLKRLFGLAYLMADGGYDVWLGNNRGNCYSRKHLKCDPDTDEEFWNFSLDELALYDMPAIIDHVLKHTGESSLNYIGYSQGSTLALILCALKPEYNSKIRFHVAVAPIVYLEYSKSALLHQISSKYTAYNIDWTPVIGKSEFCPIPDFLDLLEDDMCEIQEGIQLCNIPRFALAGFTPVAINLCYDIDQYCSCSTSINVIEHYAQIYVKNQFQRFDHGLSGNTIKYGSASPPTYDLSQVTHKIFEIVNYSDYWARGKDVERLTNVLINEIPKYVVPVPVWNHLDYILSEDSRDKVYSQIMEGLEKSYT